MPALGPRIRGFRGRVKLAAEYERLARARSAQINENGVLYESFSGNGVLCNPEAIFRALLAAADLDRLEHVWVLDKLGMNSPVVAEFADHPRVRFVEYKSSSYYAALAQSKYLVNNATFPPQFGKREGQIYLNTWHGTPLKAMGYDIAGTALDTRNVVRNLLAADYLLAPNPDTERMYLSAYRLTNLYRGATLHTGTPRIDRQFVDDAARSSIRRRLIDAGVSLDEQQQIILYAPTWKGNFYAPTNDIRQLRARVDAINAQLDTARYKLVLKVHQQVYKHALAEPGLQSILVPNDLPTNDVLAVTDVLVTDYSSLFIDFLATGRPVLFYAPDLGDYESERGFYLPPAEWPGPVCTGLDELVRQLKRLGSGGDDDPIVAFADAYAKARARYCADEDGRATERVIDVVFRGRSDDRLVKRGFSDGRKTVLLHLGGMIPNGITSSGICLVDNIDYDKYDVTVTFPVTGRPERLDLIKLINPKARVLPRFGGINGRKLQVRSLLAVKGAAEKQARSLTTHADLLRDEWTRCFGDARFDHVVDFSGYAPFWAKLLASNPGGSFSIWLHNDIRAEMDNKGRTDHLRDSVAGVVALYGAADHLVSVSEPLAAVNARGLADLAPAEKFSFARNTINFERVLHQAYGVPTRDGADDAVGAAGELVDGFDPLNLPDAVTRLMGYHGMADVNDEVQRRTTVASLLPPAPGVRTFVTVGRLSPEKNHSRLIRAFDLIHQEDPMTRLLILGSGPLEESLSQQIDSLGLTDVVNLPGHQPNPCVIVANADCFVLSSDYEGQPMVLLEALILDRPIVTTEFGSVQGALPDGYGRIVKRSVEALADGMRAFLRGEVVGKPFDYAEYNRAATREFYAAIGAE